MTALPLTVAEAVSFRTELEKGPDVALARDILRTLSERAADWGVVNKSKIWVTVKLLRASKDKDVVELAAAVTKQWKAVAMKFQKEVEEKKKKKKEDKRKKLQEYEETKLKEEAEADEMKTKLKRALALVDGKVNYPYWNKVCSQPADAHQLRAGGGVFEAPRPAPMPQAVEQAVAAHRQAIRSCGIGTLPDVWV